MSRIYNFFAGPATLPKEVLKEAAGEMLDYKGYGMSVMEMSHRSKMFTDILKETKDDLRELMDIPENYEILFLQGGATTQFAMVPLNLHDNGVADIIMTGRWTEKARDEAKKYMDVNIIATSEDEGYVRIPDLSDLTISEDADFVHICQNNTIRGTRFYELPDTKGKPLVSDMSSMILSEPVDVSKYGIIYAGAQKNVGPAGVTIIIIRKDLIKDDVYEGTPTMLKYMTHHKKDSAYNTPPTYPIYMCGLVFKHLKKIGGVKEMHRRNKKKAKLLYDYLDQSDLFTPIVEKKSRSIMNVVFKTDVEALGQTFIKEAADEGLIGLKGHRSVGGMRASIYNAMTLEGVKALVGFMERFEKEHTS